MGLFTKETGPIFLKETSDAQEYIGKLEALRDRAPEELKNQIEKQITIAKYGIAGENNIAFELKNSGMDMYVLRDIYLEYEGLSAQIDYMVVTRKHIYVLECKNLFGNIEVDNSGNFIRNYVVAGRKIREGIYSPITQNERHLNVIRQLRRESKSNFVTRRLFDKGFDTTYRSLIVLANPKTVLYAKYAQKGVREKIVRADQLIHKIKQIDAEASDSGFSNKDMLETAEFYLASNRPNQSDYAQKYEEIIAQMEKTSKPQEKSSGEEPVAEKTVAKSGSALDNATNIAVDDIVDAASNDTAEHAENLTSNVETEYEVDNAANTSSANAADNTPENVTVTDFSADSAGIQDELYAKLREFRRARSKEEKIKPYYIFNDAQMEDLLHKRPKTKADLLKVSGFGNKKVEKYGEAILAILNEQD